MYLNNNKVYKISQSERMAEWLKLANILTSINRREIQFFFINMKYILRELL